MEDTKSYEYWNLTQILAEEEDWDGWRQEEQIKWKRKTILSQIYEEDKDPTLRQLHNEELHY